MLEDYEGMDRRDFLKLSGAGIGALLLGGAQTPRVQAAWEGKGMLYDATMCVGCRACQMACKREYGLPQDIGADGLYESPGQLSASTRTLIQLAQGDQPGEQSFVKRQCMHCLHPACVSACPVGALRQTEYGAIDYDANRCIGCRYCMVACPFGIPMFEWDKALPFIQKCDMCVGRLERGLAPACADVCPTGAITFGERNSLVVEAERRISDNPQRYVSHVYGKDELGGTCVLYLAGIPFKEMGLPTLDAEPVTELSETVATFGTPSVALSVGGLLGGLYYWFSKQEKNTGAESAIDSGQ
jgi:Fe-S-cluster-containing dehydrogenase component